MLLAYHVQHALSFAGKEIVDPPGTTVFPAFDLIGPVKTLNEPDAIRVFIALIFAITLLGTLLP